MTALSDDCLEMRYKRQNPLIFRLTGFVFYNLDARTAPEALAERLEVKSARSSLFFVNDDYFFCYSYFCFY